MTELNLIVAEAIIDDLTNRKGLRHAFDNIDPDIQEEIKREWTAIIAKHHAIKWTEWRDAKPEPGCKFVVAHDDGCSSGIYVMLDDGPHCAEDGENYGMDSGALWAPLPDEYPIRFMEITEDDWR